MRIPIATVDEDQVDGLIAACGDAGHHLKRGSLSSTGQRRVVFEGETEQFHRDRDTLEAVFGRTYRDDLRTTPEPCNNCTDPRRRA